MSVELVKALQVGVEISRWGNRTNAVKDHLKDWLSKLVYLGCKMWCRFLM